MACGLRFKAKSRSSRIPPNEVIPVVRLRTLPNKNPDRESLLKLKSSATATKAVKISVKATGIASKFRIKLKVRMSISKYWGPRSGFRCQKGPPTFKSAHVTQATISSAGLLAFPCRGRDSASLLALSKIQVSGDLNNWTQKSGCIGVYIGVYRDYTGIVSG